MSCPNGQSGTGRLSFRLRKRSTGGGGWSEAEVCAEEVAAPRMTLRRIRSAGKSKSGIGERKRPLLCSGIGKIGIGNRKSGVPANHRARFKNANTS